MKKNFKLNLVISAFLFAIFIVFTAFVKLFDVAMIGNNLSEVGFSSLNKVFFDMFSKVKYDGLFPDLSQSTFWYQTSEILGYLAILVALFFVCVGICQLLKEKSFKKVDIKIYALAVFYVVVAAFYVFFELVVINYRPVLIDNALEASYPSSHTILALCIFGSAVILIKRLFNTNKKVCVIINALICIMMIVTVVARLMSGVHWFTDIVGGVLLSSALLMSFYTAICRIEQ